MAFLLLSCSRIEKESARTPLPLQEQILKLRDGYTGLTYSVGLTIIHYEPTKETADRLENLSFVCKFNERRSKPCWQNDKFGFCHVFYRKTGSIFNRKTEQHIWFYGIEKKRQELLDGNLKCFSFKVYDFDEV